MAASRAHTTTEFAVAMTLASLGEIAFSGAAPAFVAHIATPELRGSYQGAYSLCWAMASVVAPLLGPRGGSLASVRPPCGTLLRS